MRLEEEIKQSTFKNEYQKAFINLLFTSNWLQHEQGKVFRNFGITPPQFNILRILRGQYPKPATISLLIERMLDKTSNASRIVDKLEVKGLVTRKQCPHDRRTVDVIISQNGLDLLNRIDKDNIHIGVDGLSETEAQHLNTLLDKIRN
jgi:DNA-binding MarR family transcriptional regulator